MVVGPVKFSIPIDPGAAQAQLRRDRMEEKRVRVDVEMKMTTTTEQEPGGKTGAPQPKQQQNAQPAAPTSPQSSQAPREQKTKSQPGQQKPEQEQPGQQPQKRVGPSLPPPLEGNRSVAPQSTDDNFPTVQPGESLEDAREREGKQSDASPDTNPDDADKFPTIRPGENLDQAKARHAQEQGKTVRKGETPDQANIRHAREAQHKQSYKPQPPLQTPPSPQNTGAPSPEDNDRKAAGRQQEAADASGDFAAQARARGEANRTKKQPSSVTGRKSTEEQGASALYTVLGRGGSMTVAATLFGVIINAYQLLLTIFPSFNDSINGSSASKWLPQKFDLNTMKGWSELIVVLAELLLFLVFVAIVLTLLVVAYTAFTNPLMSFKALLSTF